MARVCRFRGNKSSHVSQVTAACAKPRENACFSRSIVEEAGQVEVDFGQ